MDEQEVEMLICDICGCEAPLILGSNDEIFICMMCEDNDIGCK